MSVRVIVVMGVAGSGKTTIGRSLAAQIRFAFYDADDFHPKDNVEKMRSGHPLDDHEREEWLRRLRKLIDAACKGDEPMVLACSALKATYRDALGVPDSSRALVYIRVRRELVERRLATRKDHFMPASLVPSQFDALEEPTTAIVVDGDQPPERIVRQICQELGNL